MIWPSSFSEKEMAAPSLAFLAGWQRTSHTVLQDFFEAGMDDVPSLPVKNHHPGSMPFRERFLSDKLSGEVVLEIGY